MRGFVPYEEKLNKTLCEILDIPPAKRAQINRVVQSVLLSSKEARKRSKYRRARRVEVRLEINYAPSYGKKY